MNKNKFTWNLIGVLYFLMLLIFINSFYNDFQVYKKGSVVEVIITYLPENQGTKTDNMKFKMSGRIYDKKVSSAFSNTHSVGEKIKLKYLSGYEDNFLYPDESPLFIGIIGTLLLAFLGTISFLYAKKEKSFSSH